MGRSRVFDYVWLRRQFVSSDLSLREVCRRNGIDGGRASVQRIAKAEDWLGLRRMRIEAEAREIGRRQGSRL